MAIKMEIMDTHQTIKNLMASGIPENQAEAVTNAINDTSNLATKEDIKDLKRDMKDLKRDMQYLEEKMVSKLELKEAVLELKEAVHDIIKWIVGSWVFSNIGTIIPMGIIVNSRFYNAYSGLGMSFLRSYLSLVTSSEKSYSPLKFICLHIIIEPDFILLVIFSMSTSDSASFIFFCKNKQFQQR